MSYRFRVASAALCLAFATAAVAQATTPPATSDPADYEFRTQRTVRLSGEVNRTSAIAVIQRLRYLDDNNPDGRDITLVINSGGGDIEQGMAIYDTMQNLKSDVRTVCEARAMSMAAILLAAGTPGKRTSLPNCRIMLHQISAANSGKFSEMAIQHSEYLKLNARLMEMISRHSNRDQGDVTRALIQDYFLDAEDARQIGIIDSVQNPARPLPPPGKRSLKPNF